MPQLVKFVMRFVVALGTVVAGGQSWLWVACLRRPSQCCRHL